MGRRWPVLALAGEFELEPQTVTIAKPGAYAFRAINRGGAEHALEIEGEVDGEEIEVETEEIGPGETAELRVELKPGKYELYCPVGGHKEKGMDGSVSVAGGSTGSEMDDDSDY